MYLFKFVRFLKNHDSLISAKLPKKNMHTAFVKRNLELDSLYHLLTAFHLHQGFEGLAKIHAASSRDKSMAHFPSKKSKRTKNL